MLPLTSSLDALDGAIDLLSQLEVMPAAGRGRKGRLDIAALLCEVAPNARIALEPGLGTEVFGDEAELRRLLHVLVSPMISVSSSPESSTAEILVSRDGDWIRIAVDLGPDAASAEVERRWLSRMALRRGGRLELDGARQTLVLPADNDSEQAEVADLRKELEAAQQLGEAYARELAVAFAASQGEPAGGAPEVAAAADRPVAGRHGREERFELLLASMGACSRALKSVAHAANDDAAAAQRALGESHALVTALRSRASALTELLSDLGLLTDLDPMERKAPVDLPHLVASALEAADLRRARRGVEVSTQVTGESTWHLAPQSFERLLRALLNHAIAATPRGGRVVLSVDASPTELSVELEDAGPSVPVDLREAVLAQTLDPTSVGRPPGLALLVGRELGTHLGGYTTLATTAVDRNVVRFALPRALR